MFDLLKKKISGFIGGFLKKEEEKTEVRPTEQKVEVQPKEKIIEELIEKAQKQERIEL